MWQATMYRGDAPLRNSIAAGVSSIKTSNHRAVVGADSYHIVATVLGINWRLLDGGWNGCLAVEFLDTCRGTCQTMSESEVSRHHSDTAHDLFTTGS
jgi:hypothetical protein